jgi:hypothetical protein
MVQIEEKKKKNEPKLYVIYNGESVPLGLSLGKNKEDALENFYFTTGVETSYINYAEQLTMSEGVCVFTTAI